MNVIYTISIENIFDIDFLSSYFVMLMFTLWIYEKIKLDVCQRNFLFTDQMARDLSVYLMRARLPLGFF